MKLPAPHFALARVHEDGSSEVEIVPVTKLPLDTTMSRRGFLGAAVTVGTVLAAAGCDQAKTDRPSTPKAARKADCEEAFAHLSSIYTLAVSRDGKTLASGSWDNTIELWSLPGGTLLKTLEGHRDSIRALAVSPDGKTLASGSMDKTIKLWSLPQGALLKTLTGHRDPIYALALSPDGKALASSGGDKRVKLWSLPEGESKICLTDLKATPPPAPNTYSPPSHGGGTYSYCSCSKVCTCIPVRCQAQRLLHDDPVVRKMAEEILLLVGAREFEYMTWAAENAAVPALKARIHEVMASINVGASPNPARWPSLTECISRLDHADEIVALMAARMIRQKQCRERLQIDDATKARVEEIINAALLQPWYMGK